MDQGGDGGSLAPVPVPTWYLGLVPGGGLRAWCRLPSARFSHTLICSHLMSSHMLSLAN